jgi:hypothetical protein
MKIKNNILFLLCVAGILCISESASAQIVGFQFANPKTAGNEVAVKASLVQTGLEVSPLERGGGLLTSSEGGLVRAFVAVTKTQSGASVSDTSIAVANDMYFKFEVKVDKGYKATLNSLNYKIRASGGGAKVYYWKYSTDGKTFKKLAEPVKITPIGAEGQVMPQIELTSIKELQSILEGKTIYFRLYTNGSNNTTGTTAIGRSANATSNDYVLAIDGSVEKK